MTLLQVQLGSAGEPPLLLPAVPAAVRVPVSASISSSVVSSQLVQRMEDVIKPFPSSSNICLKPCVLVNIKK